MEELKEILKEYNSFGYSVELAERFKDIACAEECKGCPLDVKLGEHIACDHLIHGDRVSYW